MPTKKDYSDTLNGIKGRLTQWGARLNDKDQPAANAHERQRYTDALDLLFIIENPLPVKADVVQEPMVTLAADIRCALTSESDRLHQAIGDETPADEEGQLRAQMAGVDWALATICRLMVYHRATE